MTPRKPRKSRAEPRKLWDIAVELHARGWITQPVQIDEKCVLCKPRLTWRVVCREASSIVGGMWHTGAKGVRWQMQHKNSYLLNPAKIEELKRVRTLTQTVTGLEPGWSVGSCAARFLKWALLKCEATPLDAILQDGPYIGYHECSPGRYSYGAHFDLSGCYYQLISRLPSPRLGINKHGQIVDYPLLPDERVKWNETKEIIRDEKSLRNAMWGTMLGSTIKRPYFCKGAEGYGGIYPGTHWAAAALVARSAWELCRNAAEETSAVYAQTDCVVVTSDSCPRYWDKYGLQYRNQWSGDSHILYQHSYKVGDFHTKWYDENSKFADAVQRPDAPQRQFHTEWL